MIMPILLQNGSIGMKWKKGTKVNDIKETFSNDKERTKKKNKTIVDNWIRCFGMQEFKTKKRQIFIYNLKN